MFVFLQLQYFLGLQQLQLIFWQKSYGRPELDYSPLLLFQLHLDIFPGVLLVRMIMKELPFLHYSLHITSGLGFWFLKMETINLLFQSTFHQLAKNSHYNLPIICNYFPTFCEHFPTIYKLFAIIYKPFTTIYKHFTTIYKRFPTICKNFPNIFQQFSKFTTLLNNLQPF